MCLALYIASSQLLPLVPFVKHEPSFSVAEVSSYELCVKKQFTLPYVYYAGAQGCGCGFLREGDTGEELEKIEDNYLKLWAYIHEARRGGAMIQLFYCWVGDQGSVPEFRESIDEDILRDEEFGFKEKAFYQIK